jgi:Lrp/AsnC family transcriptional regulator for asnA, asnC and gidA
MLRVAAAPGALRGIGAWLADRSETRWVSALSRASECIVELFAGQEEIGPLLYNDLARVEGVRDFSLEPIFEYYRTVSGWRPDLLTREQYDALSRSELPQYVTRYEDLGMPRLDEPNQALVDILRTNGRATIEELAAGLSVSKATASRRLESLIASGAVFVRAILDPSSIGYPFEAFLTVRTAPGDVDAVGAYVAELPTTRWAANVSGQLLVQTAARSVVELRSVVEGIEGRPGVLGVELSLYAEIFKRSTVAYVDGRLPALAAD